MIDKKRSWQKLGSNIVYKDPWMEIVADDVIKPDGSRGVYAYMKKSDGNFIIAMDGDKNVYLIEEFRYPINKSILQLIAGSHDGQDELESAKKELKEEAGIVAKTWKRLGGFYQGPGHETIYDSIYLATDLDLSGLNTTLQEGNESILRILKVSIEELKKMVKENKINCAMSVAGLNLFFLQMDAVN